jgi:hypothetical protein
MAYSYLLLIGTTEIVGYHWGPEGIGAGTHREPHVHFQVPSVSVPPEFQAQIELFRRAHWPTGQIAFQSILRMAMREFGVAPLPIQGRESAEVRLLSERALEVAEHALKSTIAM